MLQLLAFVFDALSYVLRLYSIILFVAAVLRMARADETSMIGRMVFPLLDIPAGALTKKFPKLRMYHSGAYMDFSPLILIIAIELLIMLLFRIRNIFGV